MLQKILQSILRIFALNQVRISEDHLYRKYEEYLYKRFE